MINEEKLRELSLEDETIINGFIDGLKGRSRRDAKHQALSTENKKWLIGYQSGRNAESINAFQCTYPNEGLIELIERLGKEIYVDGIRNVLDHDIDYLSLLYWTGEQSGFIGDEESADCEMTIEVAKLPEKLLREIDVTVCFINATSQLPSLEKIFEKRIIARKSSDQDVDEIIEMTEENDELSSEQKRHLAGYTDIGFEAVDVKALSEHEKNLLVQFYALMKSEMLSNNNKGDFASWLPNGYELIAETAYHLAKLNKAVLEVERGGLESSRLQVDEFAADVANYMAKTAQIFGELKPSDPSPNE